MPALPIENTILPNPASDMTHRFDIIISGASFTGAALAVSLSQSLEGALSVAVLDRDEDGAPVRPSPRAFAISAASRNLLDAIGAWPLIEPEAQAVSEIEITDSSLDAGIRPVLLTYDNALDDGHPASYIVPDAVLASALKQRLKACGATIFHATTATDFAAGPQFATVHASSASSGEEKFNTDLAVAAEGRQSAIREAAGLKQIGWDYDQLGICAVVEHSRPHNGRATQHFLPSGPFAILPLRGDKSCVTWTEKKSEARRILALDADGFEAEVERRFAGRLGDLKVTVQPASWPLSLKMSRGLVAPRLALLGDTVRTVHPIAGQGLNLGLRDVAALAEVIAETACIGLPPSHPDTLRRYEKWRRFDSVVSSAAFDSLNRLFANDNTFLRSLREAGLGLVDRLPLAKSLLVREAAGMTGDVPKLLRGERL